MVDHLDFSDWPHGYRKWKRQRSRTARSMQHWLSITSIQIYGKKSWLLAVQAHYYKQTMFWSHSPRSKKSWSMMTSMHSHGYAAWDHAMPTHCCKLLYRCYKIVSLRLDYVTDSAIIWPHIALSMMTSMQSHGHAAWDHKMPAHCCKLLYRW
jgi:hypothetical protein